MKVIRARVSGFCMGVRRAVDLALSAASEAQGNPVYTLGSLIHNPKALSDLKELGIKSVDSSDMIKNQNSVVIIRAHGINPKAENDLKVRGFRIIDATCPNVKKNQLKAKELSSAGYFMFLAGEREHAEITGLLGYCGGFCEITGDEEQAKEAALKFKRENINAKAALLGQTTISNEEYTAIGNEIKKIISNLEIIDTICAATAERMKSLRELLSITDCVIIAGGRKSANTLRLYAIAKESGKPCVIAEGADEIPREFFKYKNAGLCAGASTPDSVIDEIEAELYKTHFA